MSSEQLQTEINSLRESVNSLKRQVDEENKGFLKRWSGVLALIAAIFAVPHGAIELFNAINSLFTRPHTSLYVSPPLIMSYDPQQKAISFTLSVSVANNGTRNDVIRAARARLETTSSPASQIHFASSDFNINSGGAPVAFPFNVGKESSKELTCSVSSSLGGISMDALHQSGERHLIIELVGEKNRTYTQKFCFHLTQGVIDGVFKAETTQVRRFLTSTCDL
jgi:hypothetical protein